MKRKTAWSSILLILILLLCSCNAESSDGGAYSPGGEGLDETGIFYRENITYEIIDTSDSEKTVVSVTIPDLIAAYEAALAENNTQFEAERITAEMLKALTQRNITETIEIPAGTGDDHWDTLLEAAIEELIEAEVNRYVLQILIESAGD